MTDPNKSYNSQKEVFFIQRCVKDKVLYIQYNAVVMFFSFIAFSNFSKIKLLLSVWNGMLTSFWWGKKVLEKSSPTQNEPENKTPKNVFDGSQGESCCLSGQNDWYPLQALTTHSFMVVKFCSESTKICSIFVILILLN